MAKFRMSKELREIQKLIKPYGYYIEKTKKHNKIRDKDGKMLIGFSSSPSDRHAYKNVVKDLIKLGFLPDVNR